jgi:glycosyltransferase involved in cell wall biosynthesis
MPAYQKLKILFLIPNLSDGGGQKAVFNLYKSLDKNKFDVSILAHEKWGAFLHEVDEDMNISFVKNRAYKRLDIFHLLLATIHYARSVDIIVGGLEGRASFLGLVAAKILKKPIITWIHIDWLPFIKLVSWRQKLSLKSYKYADHVVTCSQGVANNLETIFSIKQSRIQTIYNGMPSDKIRKLAYEPLPDSVKSIFELPTVINVGRLHYQKGQNYLIEAHAMLIRKGIQHNLIIIGQGDLLSQLKQQATELGVSNSVHFLGFQNNPYKFMKNATVFAFSSRFEGFPLVLAEALLCEVPIISTDCPSGPYETLEAGKYGVLVKPSEPKALADGLEEILCNNVKRDEFSKLSLIRSEAFDERKTTAQWEALFEKLGKSILSRNQTAVSYHI